MDVIDLEDEEIDAEVLNSMAVTQVSVQCCVCMCVTSCSSVRVAMDTVL